MSTVMYIGDTVLNKVICWNSAIFLVPPGWISRAFEPTVQLLSGQAQTMASFGCLLAQCSPSGVSAIELMQLIHPCADEIIFMQRAK